MSLTEELQAGYAPGVPQTIAVTGERLTDMLEAVAARYPDRAALDFLSRQMTYKELLENSRKGAKVLADAGVREGDRVGMVMPNCPQHVVAVFAALWLGAIVVEHNPLAPADELRHEFDNHGARVVIAWENSMDKLAFLQDRARVFSMDLTRALPGFTQTALKLPVPALRKRRATLSTKPPRWTRSWDRSVQDAGMWKGECPVDADAPALLLHTGGTTGVPKAGILTHKNLRSNISQSLAWVPPLHEGSEVFNCVLPLFHAFGFTIGCMCGLALGATVALFPKFDPAMMLTSQKRLPCTFMLGVPPMYERLLAAAKTLDADLSSMKFSLSGAMPLDADLAARWEKATGGYLIEGYGMTEASPIILGSPVSADRRPGFLGLPFPSTEVRIVDPEDISRDMPDGEVGELIARGPQVFQGYWGNDEETAVTLVDGWLRTGDLVKNDGGSIIMADRRKEMINSSGFNVFPSQVEEAVRTMPGVEDVAVVGVPGGVSGEEVVAALVLEAGSSLTTEDVRKWAEKSLAHYALPRQIVVLQELPRSQLGKVMRKKVREEVLDLQERFTSLSDQASAAIAEARQQAGAALDDARDARAKRAEGTGSGSSGKAAGGKPAAGMATGGKPAAGMATDGKPAGSRADIDTPTDTSEDSPAGSGNDGEDSSPTVS